MPAARGSHTLTHRWMSKARASPQMRRDAGVAVGIPTTGPANSRLAEQRRCAASAFEHACAAHRRRSPSEGDQWPVSVHFVRIRAFEIFILAFTRHQWRRYSEHSIVQVQRANVCRYSAAIARVDNHPFKPCDRWQRSLSPQAFVARAPGDRARPRRRAAPRPARRWVPARCRRERPLCESVIEAAAPCFAGAPLADERLREPPRRERGL